MYRWGMATMNVEELNKNYESFLAIAKEGFSNLGCTCVEGWYSRSTGVCLPGSSTPRGDFEIRIGHVNASRTFGRTFSVKHFQLECHVGSVKRCYKLTPEGQADWKKILKTFSEVVQEQAKQDATNKAKQDHHTDLQNQVAKIQKAHGLPAEHAWLNQYGTVQVSLTIEQFEAIAPALAALQTPDGWLSLVTFHKGL